MISLINKTFMHQTFYIDIDEEITSLIDRLRKSKTKENIFVIPKRALILQSVVNLKVLKKEASGFKKQIMIVTQDEQGRAISEKVGILSQSSLEGVEETDELKMEIRPTIKIGQRKTSAEKAQRKKILEDIGSDSFYASGEEVVMGGAAMPQENTPPDKKEKKSIGTGKKVGRKIAVLQSDERHGTMSDIVGAAKSGVATSTPMMPTAIEESESLEGDDEGEDENTFEDYEKEMDPIKKQELAEFYRFGSGDNPEVEEKKPVMVHGKARKIFILFGAISLAAVLLLAVFLLMPKAKVNIELSSRIQTTELEIKGVPESAETPAEEKTVPIRILELEKEKSVNFPTSGKSTISDQKARGIISVYNEYSAAAQPLVATTRFITPDGRIFRLVKGVTVPGMAQADGKTNPGVIEAEVVADESGEEFNIQPTTLSIPGFEGSPKYSKFYARASKPMIGGGSKGDEVAVIAEADISAAKKEVENVLKEEMLAEMKSRLESDAVILEEAVEVSVIEAYAPEAGSIADSFDFRSKMKIRLMAFSEQDLRVVMEGSFGKKAEEKIAQLKIEYGKATVDFENKTLLIKIHGKALLEPVVDVAQLKQDLLGKDQKEIEELLQNHPQIKGLEAEFWPEFLPGKIPTSEKRVELEIVPSEF